MKKLLLIFFGFIVSFATIEIFLRAFYPQKTLSSVQSFTFKCFEQGERRWIKLRKNNECLLSSYYDAYEPVVVKTNSLGMRNPEIDYEKPANTKRLLFIGDSFTMGWGVKEEQSFPRLTEKLLNSQNLPQKIESVNAGFTAAGPSGYYLSLKLEGIKFDPDIVLIGFFLGNDILSRKDVNWVKVDKQGLPDVVRSKSSYVDFEGQIRLKTTPLKYQMPYLRESHLFILFMDRIFAKTEDTTQDKLVRDTICVFNKDCHEFDQGKQEIKTIFSAMDKLLKNQSKRLIVILIPTHFQVHFDAGYKARYNLPLLPTERRFLNDEFISYFEANDIDYIDLLPNLLESAGTQKLYFNRDDHWNSGGHKIAAEAIADKLMDYLK